MRNLAKYKIIFFAAVACLLNMTACSSHSPRGSYTLELGQDAYVKGKGVEAGLRKKGEKLTLESAPIQVEAPGHISMLILPQATSSAHFTVELQPQRKWDQGEIEKKSNALLNEILPSINQIHKNISLKQHKEALANTQTLIQNHPKVTYLRFLRASIYALQGKREQAKQDLEDALADFPDQKEARALYRSLASQDSQAQSRSAQ